MTDLSALEDLRRRGMQFGPGRRKDAELIDLLNDCHIFAVDVQRSGLEHELIAAVENRGAGSRNNGRLRFLQDTLLGRMVARYVFEDGKESRANMYRYGKCLQAALDAQIAPGALGDTLRAQGGIVAMVLAQMAPGDTGCSKVVRLDESISYEVGRTYTLTIRCTGRETYRLIHMNETRQ